MSLLEKTRELQEPIRSFFWGDEPRFLCEDICYLYGIPEGRVGDVSFFVAPLLTRTLPLANLPKELRVKFPDLSEGVTFGLAYELNKRIVYKFPEEFPEALPLLSEWEKKKEKPTLSEEEAHKKTLAAESWYLDWKRQNEQAQVSEAVTKEPQTASLPLLDAMAKYQRLSEQNITEDRITVKGESQPVRGSLRNWIRHYRDTMGIRKHSAVERGQFLFQGENTRRLGAPEREKLSVVFRSLEENTPISIDVERQEIVFPEFSENTVKTVESSEQKNAKESPALGTTFRPLEKFPAKQAPIRKALEWEVSGVSKSVSPSSPAPIPAPPSIETKNPLPEPGKARVVGVSAPVYSFPSAPTPPQKPIIEPVGLASGSASITHDTTPLPASPFAAPGSISFSSSHVLPGEKDVPREDHQSISKSVSSEPEAISIIKPRGNGFGFRGATSFSGKPEK